MDAYKFAEENLLAYSGDCDAAAYGGTFYNLNRDHYRNGYIEALRITPSEESDCPVIWVESLTVIIDKPGSKQWRDAASSLGWQDKLPCEAGETIGSLREFLHRVAEMFCSYGHYDPACLGYEHHTLTVAVEPIDPDSPYADGVDETCTGSWETDTGETIAEFDEGRFWRLVQERVNSTFTDQREALTAD